MHTAQGTSVCLRPLCDSAAKEAESDLDEEGRDDERWCVESVAGLGVEFARGTPHNPHIFAAAGLNPGGFRYAHTSHSQLSNRVSGSLGPEIGPPERWQVTLGEDLKSPA